VRAGDTVALTAESCWDYRYNTNIRLADGRSRRGQMPDHDLSCGYPLDAALGTNPAARMDGKSAWPRDRQSVHGMNAVALEWKEQIRSGVSRDDLWSGYQWEQR
jgi:hypothetical protein